MVSENSKRTLSFDFFGTRFCISVDDPRWAERIFSLVPRGSVPASPAMDEHRFELVTLEPIGNGFFWDRPEGRELIYGFGRFGEELLAGLEMKLIFALALICPPAMNFFHAGAVSYRGSGILIPGFTRSGKTSLVAEFVRRGARYYTDDCAFVDAGGLIHPNTIPMGIREGDGRIHLTAADLGGREATEPIRVDYILLTRFEAGAVWQPAPCPPGTTAFRLLDSLFYRDAVRRNPCHSLDLAGRLAGGAVCLEGARGEASAVVKWFEDRIGRKAARKDE